MVEGVEKESLSSLPDSLLSVHKSGETGAVVSIPYCAPEGLGRLEEAKSAQHDQSGQARARVLVMW